jgi:hypothetical protein
MEIKKRRSKNDSFKIDLREYLAGSTSSSIRHGLFTKINGIALFNDAEVVGCMRKLKRAYTQKDVDLAKYIFEQNQSYDEVAAELQCSVSSVCRWRKQNWVQEKRRTTAIARADIEELHIPVGKLNDRQLTRAIMHVKL